MYSTQLKSAIVLTLLDDACNQLKLAEKLDCGKRNRRSKAVHPICCGLPVAYG